MPLQKANSSKCLQKTTSMRWESNRSSSILGELGTRKLENTMTGNRIEKIPDSHFFRKWSTLLYNQWIRTYTHLDLDTYPIRCVTAYLYLKSRFYILKLLIGDMIRTTVFKLHVKRSSWIGSWHWRCIQQNPMYWFDIQHADNCKHLPSVTISSYRCSRPFTSK